MPSDEEIRQISNDIQDLVARIHNDAAEVDMLARRLQSSSGGGAFDPINDIAWFAAWWADDPNWTPPSDGADVTQWDDASGNGRHATEATIPPSFDAVNANFNNRATVHFDGSEQLTTASWTDLTQPNTLFVVGKFDVIGTSNRMLIDSLNVDDRHTLYVAFDSATHMFAGTGNHTIANPSDTNTHYWYCLFNGASSDGRQDGIDGGFTNNPGPDPCSGLTLGSSWDSANPATGDLAFVGVYDGAMTTADRDALESWAASYYGI